MIAEVIYAMAWIVVGWTLQPVLAYAANFRRARRTRLHVPTVRQMERAQRRAKTQLGMDRQQHLRVVRPGDAR